MSIHHLNDARAIARAAKQVGATMPSSITAALEHLEAIMADAPTAPRPGVLARELAGHLGDAAAMTKARKAAVTVLVTAHADVKIYQYLAEVCGVRLRSMMSVESEAIAAAFGDALEDDLAMLQANAGKLPAWFRPEHAGTLDPDQFAAWSLARVAYARITATHSALHGLYARATDGDEFPPAAAASLRFAKPAPFTNPKDAYGFREALRGRAERVQGMAEQGSTWVDGIFIPTALAHTGATFEWATPEEVAQRSRHTVDAMIDRPAPVDAGTAHAVT